MLADGGQQMLFLCRLIAAVIVVANLPPAAPTTHPTTAPTTAPASVVRSQDESIELTLPPTWELVTEQRHRDFQLFVSSPSLHMSVGVKTFTKDDLVDVDL